MRETLLVDLSSYANSFGATFNSDRTAGVMNAWGNSFPAEELPLGATFVTNGLPFRLSEKRNAHWDHVEGLGQTIRIEWDRMTGELALLCCGEMGDQELEVQACSKNSTREAITFLTRGWLVPGSAQIENAAFRASHLHYVGDYELDLLTPVLWTARRKLRKPMLLSELEFGWNPLFHVFGLTLFEANPEA